MALVSSNDLDTQSLSGFFVNPENAPVCARCILGASTKGFKQGIQAVGSKIFWSNFTQKLGYWRSQMQFLFAVRTEEETKTMLSRLNRCSCSMKDRRIVEYHRIGRLMEGDLYTRTYVDGQTSAVYLITDMFCALSYALDLSHIRSVAKRTNTKWPTCPEDLMPFGPENLAQSLVIWSRIIPNHIVITLAIQCIGLCGSLLVPSVISSGLTREVVDAGRRLFDITWETIRLRAERRRRGMGEAFADQVLPLKKYFFEFFSPLSVRQQAAALEGCELKAVQLFSLLAYAAEDPRLYTAHPIDYKIELAERGLTLYRCLRLYVNPLPQVLIHPTIYDLCDLENSSDEEDEGEGGTGNGQKEDHRCVHADENQEKSGGDGEGDDDDDDGHEAEDENEDWDEDEVEGEGESENEIYEDEGDSEEDSADEVEDKREQAPTTNTKNMALFAYVARPTVEHIRKARSTLYCSTQDCPNSIQSAGREFRRCVGCKVALYCSRKCQTEAWNAEQYPHKEVCKVLQKMIAVAGSELLFRHLECEHRGYPDDLKSTVIARWWEGSVNIPDLVVIEGWASYKRLPASEFFKADCSPGYDDYDAIVRELSERDPANLRPRYLTLESLASKKALENLKKSFKEMRTWSKTMGEG
ncbi:hypothetical protein BDN70DRAFT_877910 [Pholiota conissans]|uniref:MYND-type domain-containing protein n=1 Tax=Pholiota conissans TaxID=109636 RepID=A0A9P5Z683_9AGAR|nr:hypothetical protein BDN70DRAFT_877910 [Pholiota conissans]